MAWIAYTIVAAASVILLTVVYGVDRRQRRREDAPVIKSVRGMDNPAVQASRKVC